MVLGPAALTLPGNLLEIYFFSPHLRPKCLMNYQVFQGRVELPVNFTRIKSPPWKKKKKKVHHELQNLWEDSSIKTCGWVKFYTSERPRQKVSMCRMELPHLLSSGISDIPTCGLTCAPILSQWAGLRPGIWIAYPEPGHSQAHKTGSFYFQHIGPIQKKHPLP